MIGYSSDDFLDAVLQVFTSMEFDVNQIDSITRNAISNSYKDDTTWQVDLEDKKQRYMNHGAWTDWVYM